MFLRMAGGGPFGQLGGVVLVFVAGERVQHVHVHGVLVRSVFQSTGGIDLAAPRATFVRDDTFKRGDVRVEMRDKVRRQAVATAGMASQAAASRFVPK